MNDYERRFRRSLQKLTVPSWYNDTTPSSHMTSTSRHSIISTQSIPWKTHSRETQRTPEIIHLQHPCNYRSCRSSLATSPSPSIHSWHPNHVIDGMTFSLLKSSSSCRRNNKYEKGIERVSKSSRWYQPTRFTPDKTAPSQTGTVKISTTIRQKQHAAKNNHHYDTPKLHLNDQNIIFESTSLVTNGSVKNLIVNEHNNNVIANDKQQDNHINSNESQIMPMADTKESFSRFELDDVTDREDDKRSLSMETKKTISSITNLSLSSKQMMDEEVLERVANDLVRSVLADILLLENLDDDDDDNDEDDQNSGVRELSDDENGLRELDENDMNDTDEFIVFAAKADSSDDEQTSNTPRCSLNRLYTFSRTNNTSSESSKPSASNQNSPRSIVEEDEKTISLQSNSNAEQQASERLCPSSPVYHFHHEKQDIHLHKYIDSMMCPPNRQLSTHHSNEGVNEETARIGRLLLNSIPTPFIENTTHDLSPTPTSNQLIPQTTQCILSDHDNHHHSPREDYHQQPRLIDEYHDESIDKVRRDSAYSSNQERIDISQSCYEPLFECYSGYSFIQSDFLTPNISSMQSTTDEAYESEPTTMSSSIRTTTHVHPDLEHEFEYPVPPPPVPDRRLKPAYLKTTIKSQVSKQDNVDSAGYSIVQKVKPSPLTVIQQLITSTSNNSTSVSAKTMSSRYYCGSIPVSNESTHSSSINSTPIKLTEHSKDKKKEKRPSKALSCLHPSTTDENRNNIKRNSITKSPLSLSKTKTKKRKLITDFDEATNGLAIRLPAPISNGHHLTNKQNLNSSSTPLQIKRTNGMTKNRQIPEHIKSDRLPFYETSV